MSSSLNNPYRSPSAATEPVSRPTRWRIAIVTLLLVFGAVGLIATPIPLLVAYRRPPVFGGGVTWIRLGGVSLSAVASVLWLASGVLCWRGRWLLACIGVAIAVLAGLGAGHLLADLGL